MYQSTKELIAIRNCVAQKDEQLDFIWICLAAPVQKRQALNVFWLRWYFTNTRPKTHQTVRSLKNDIFDQMKSIRLVRVFLMADGHHYVELSIMICPITPQFHHSVSFYTSYANLVDIAQPYY